MKAGGDEMRILLIASATALLGGCGQADRGGGANQAAANTAQPKKKAAYCFFEDAKMKGWSAFRGKDGNIAVKGKAYREDSRYKAVLGPPEISGAAATVTPTITTNTGYASPDGWWDVAATIPNSTAIDTIVVTCGGKTLATLPVKPKG
jgi:hypothetical protein